MTNTPIIVRNVEEVESVHMIKFAIFVRTVKGVLCVNIINSNNSVGIVMDRLFANIKKEELAVKSVRVDPFVLIIN